MEEPIYGSYKVEQEYFDNPKHIIMMTEKQIQAHQAEINHIVDLIQALAEKLKDMLLITNIKP